MRFKDFLRNLGSFRNKKNKAKNCEELSSEGELKQANDYSELGQSAKEAKQFEYKELVQKISDGKINIAVLKDLFKLDGKDKSFFLEEIKNKLHDDRLQDLINNVMKNAINLFAKEDFICFLRRSEDSTFRDLFYLSAKRNGFSAEIDENGILMINLPRSILESYKILVHNFYVTKFRDKEFQEKISELHKKSLEKLNDTSEEAIENYYVKQSLAQSTMCLLISRDIREQKLSKRLLELSPFKKLCESEKFKTMEKLSDTEDGKKMFVSGIIDYGLNDTKGIYINSLAVSNILELTMYSQSANEIETIKILGEANIT